MDTKQQEQDTEQKWSSLPWETQQAVSRLVHDAESNPVWADGGIALNLTGPEADDASIAHLKQLARTVGYPHVRIVNGEDYFRLSSELVSLIKTADANQLVLF